jgi:hypothetical protein
MTGDVVNLRTARKRKARAAREAEAAQNRVVYGQTKAEKEARKANADLARHRLDQLQRTPRDDDGSR